jgi:hypothetical protein
MYVAGDREQWWVVENMLMTLGFHKKVWNFITE